MLGTALAARTIPASMKEKIQKLMRGTDSKGRPMHLLRLTFVGSNTTEPVLSAACHKYDLDFNILLSAKSTKSKAKATARLPW